MPSADVPWFKAIGEAGMNPCIILVYHVVDRPGSSRLVPLVVSSKVAVAVISGFIVRKRSLVTGVRAY